MIKNNREKHGSYGLLGFTRSTNSFGKNLFGSKIKHRDVIVMRLYHAEKERHLNNNYYFTDKNLPIVEIEMSLNQFADIMGGLNQGNGFPVTITYADGKEIEACPEQVNTIELFKQEFAEDITKFKNSINKAVKETQNLLKKKGKINKGELQSIHDKILKIEQDMKSNLPYITGQFKEQMEDTVHEAKAEVESFINNKILSLGTEELTKQLKENSFVLPEIKQIKLPKKFKLIAKPKRNKKEKKDNEK